MGSRELLTGAIVLGAALICFGVLQSSEEGVVEHRVYSVRPAPPPPPMPPEALLVPKGPPVQSTTILIPPYVELRMTRPAEPPQSNKCVPWWSARRSRF